MNTYATRAGWWATLLLAIVAASETMALVPADSILPMDIYTFGVNVVALPPDAGTLRGLVISCSGAQDPGVGWSGAVFATRESFGLVSFKSGTITNYQQFLDEVAAKTGHREISNLPYVWHYDRWVLREVIEQLGADRCIALTVWDSPGDASIAPKALSMTYKYECRNEEAIPGIPGSCRTLRSQGVPLCYMPVWGWSRGGFQAWDYIAHLTEWAVANRLPPGPPPADGKVTLRDVRIEDGWLGDPETWYGEWPQVYPYSQYPGDKSMAPWIPNEYLAYVWKALVAKDSVLMNKENSLFGIMHMGSHADATWACSSPPRIGVVTPISVHNKVPYSVIRVPRDTTLTLQIQTTYPDVQEIELYDGNRLLGTYPGSVYRLWKVPCRLDTPGVRAIIVHATLAGGKRVTSWPAMVYVDTEPSGAATAVAAHSREGRASSVSLRIVRAVSAADGAVDFTVELTKDIPVGLRFRDLRGRPAGRRIAETNWAAGTHTVRVTSPGGAVGAWIVELSSGGHRIHTATVARF